MKHILASLFFGGHGACPPNPNKLPTRTRMGHNPSHVLSGGKKPEWGIILGYVLFFSLGLGGHAPCPPKKRESKKRKSKKREAKREGGQKNVRQITQKDIIRKIILPLPKVRYEPGIGGALDFRMGHKNNLIERGLYFGAEI